MTYPAIAPKQTITCYSPETFEPWSYVNPDTIGIGGSETALTQMAEHLAARGHSVRVYAPIPPNTPTPHKGVEWLHIDQTDYTRPGHWIVSRAPEIADRFSLQHRAAGQTLWLICQDEDYDHKWKDRPDRRMKFDRIVALCQAQAAQFRLRYPPIADRVCVSSNGVRRDLVESVLAENLARDPYRIIYTSSPDRGLDPLLAIFERVREYESRATLHVCYGFDNLDKHVRKCEAVDPATLLAKERRYLRWIRELKAKLKAPGVVHHGRMPQRELYRQIAQASVWMYCTSFRESNCITSMEHQSLGAIPIVSPVWAVAENVRHGIHVAGHPRDWLTQATFAGEAFRLMLDGARQEKIRRVMMPWAREFFAYEKWCAQWEGWMVEDGK